jgi:hypothetical protein
MCCFWVESCTLAKKESQSAIFNQKQHIFCRKNAVVVKGHNQNMFGPHILDSAYFSDAKTTFRMFGMICFGIDSQTHTLCLP